MFLEILLIFKIVNSKKKKIKRKRFENVPKAEEVGLFDSQLTFDYN